MRRKIIGRTMAGTLMLLVAYSSATAQDATPPPWIRGSTDRLWAEFIGFGRTEMPDHGYAITFPEGWAVFRSDQAAMDASVRRSADSMNVETPETPYVVDSIHVVGPEPRPGELPMLCIVALEFIPGLSAEEYAASTVEALEPFGDYIQVTDGPVELALPVGDVTRISYDTESEDGPLRSTVYIYAEGETFTGLTCAAPERPADQWLSIAETFEFLPAE